MASKRNTYNKKYVKKKVKAPKAPRVTKKAQLEAEYETELKKAKRRIQRAARYAKNQGYVFELTNEEIYEKHLKKPKRITEASIRKIKSVNADTVQKYGYWTDEQTGELVPLKIHKKQVAKEKAKAKKKAKKQPVKKSKEPEKPTKKTKKETKKKPKKVTPEEVLDLSDILYHEDLADISLQNYTAMIDGIEDQTLRNYFNTAIDIAGNYISSDEILDCLDDLDFGRLFWYEESKGLYSLIGKKANNFEGLLIRKIEQTAGTKITMDERLQLAQIMDKSDIIPKI